MEIIGWPWDDFLVHVKEMIGTDQAAEHCSLCVSTARWTDCDPVGASVEW
jgi:hypothetical protein